MKLRFSPTSPYVRKVMVCAHELGVAGNVEKMATNPWSADTDLTGHNPLGKVPALIRDDAPALFDSPVICEYLDGLDETVKLFPQAGEKRWQALRLQALADGILDASVARFLEAKRAPGEQSQSWISRQRDCVHRTLDVLETEVLDWGDDLTIGQVGVGCALGYLDLRFDQDQWREDRPNLRDWYGVFSQRDSMLQTIPVPPPE